jgi:hypothetical protein
LTAERACGRRLLLFTRVVCAALQTCCVEQVAGAACTQVRRFVANAFVRDWILGCNFVVVILVAMLVVACIVVVFTVVIVLVGVVVVVVCVETGYNKIIKLY